MPSRRTAFALLLSLLLTFVPLHGQNDDDDKPDPAPRFHAKTLEGELFNNESIKGKVVLLDFWTTWCKYCHQEAEMVDFIANQYSKKDLIVLAINVAESKKTVKKYLEQFPRTTSKVIMTEDTNLAAMYQANVYPIYVLIDRDGNIVGEQRGAAGERGIRNLLRRAGIGGEDEASN